MKKPDIKHNMTIENASNFPIIEFPPKVETMGCKPIFFDLVNKLILSYYLCFFINIKGFSFLKYPNIDKKIKEEKQGFFKSAINRFNIFRK